MPAAVDDEAVLVRARQCPAEDAAVLLVRLRYVLEPPRRPELLHARASIRREVEATGASDARPGRTRMSYEQSSMVPDWNDVPE